MQVLQREPSVGSMSVQGGSGAGETLGATHVKMLYKPSRGLCTCVCVYVLKHVGACDVRVCVDPHVCLCLWVYTNVHTHVQAQVRVFSPSAKAGPDVLVELLARLRLPPYRTPPLPDGRGGDGNVAAEPAGRPRGCGSSPGTSEVRRSLRT